MIPAIFHQLTTVAAIGTGPVVVGSIKEYGSGSTIRTCVRVQNGKNKAIKMPDIRNAL
jgi:hypothetical protein